MQNTLKLIGPVKYPVKGVFRLNAPDISVPLSAIGRYAGGGAYPPSRNMIAAVRRMRDRARDLSDPAAAYAIYPEAILRNHAGFFPQNRESNTKTDITHIALAVCTLGFELEKASEEYSASQDMLEAFFLDAAGTALLQSFSQKVKDMLAQAAQSSGLYWTEDFTPGCGPMDIHAQAEIFKLTDAGRIGVRLLESAMLWPLKSISFAAELSPRPSASVNRKSCETCTHLNCQFREKRSDANEKNHHRSDSLWRQTH